MDILQYLLELLQSHKEVGIDGLGTIYKQKTPGRYDVDTHMFLPPSYILAFTPEVKEDENLLNYVKAKRNISADSARYFIAQFVSDIHKNLEQKSEFKLEGIGKLSNQNGTIDFSPESSLNTGFDYYALPAIPENMDPEERPTANAPVEEKCDTDLSDENNMLARTDPTPEEVKSEDTAHIPIDALSEPAEEPVHAKSPTETTPAQEEVFEEISEAPLNTQPKTEIKEGFSNQIETVEKSYEEIENELANDFDKAFEQKQSDISYPENEPAGSGSGLKIFLIILLVLLVLGAIAYFVKPNLFNLSKNNTQSVSTLPEHQGKVAQTQADSLSLADSIMRAAHQAGLKVEPSKDTLKVTTQTKPLQPTTYEVIGAAFATQKEVDDFIRNMKNKGIDAKVIPAMPGKIYKKVSIASYSNIDSAKKDLKELRVKFKNPELYIFINEHK
ncbi:SPOR domain-containing protein [Pedobacter sp.]|uniref:HU domain-containing protein n=1 Tax=Pedobacter sp. TaxID=1411316 RepID=UPI00396CEDEF